MKTALAIITIICLIVGGATADNIQGSILFVGLALINWISMWGLTVLQEIEKN